jgi:uncharacterized membrane protein YdjX (TVP38/TMEM64 family)
MRSHHWKLIGLVVLVALGFFLLRTSDLQAMTPERIRSWMLSFGIWAPVFYILFYTIRPLVFFPAVILTLAGGLAFGVWWGTLYVLIGASLGAYLSFGLARILGRETIQRWLGPRLQKLDVRLSGHGFQTVFFLRLVPLFPFDAVSYSAGLSRVRFRDYAPATTLGMVPGVVAYNFLGDSLSDAFSSSFYLAVGFVVLLALLPLIYRKVNQARSRQKE